MEFTKDFELYHEGEIAAVTTEISLAYIVPAKGKAFIESFANMGNRSEAFANALWTMLIDGQIVYPWGVFSHPLGTVYRPQLFHGAIELKGGQLFEVRTSNTHATLAYNFVLRIGIKLITEEGD